MIDYDRLNLVAEKRWHIRPQDGKWYVMQENEQASCLLTLSSHEDLREAIDMAEEHGAETLAFSAKVFEAQKEVKWTTEFTMNPGEEPAITPDPLVAFLQLTAASHPGLNDEARRLIHQAAEAQATP